MGNKETTHKSANIDLPTPVRIQQPVVSPQAAKSEKDVKDSVSSLANESFNSLANESFNNEINKSLLDGGGTDAKDLSSPQNEHQVQQNLALETVANDATEGLSSAIANNGGFQPVGSSTEVEQESSTANRSLFDESLSTSKAETCPVLDISTGKNSSFSNVCDIFPEKNASRCSESVSSLNDNSKETLQGDSPFHPVNGGGNGTSRNNSLCFIGNSAGKGYLNVSVGDLNRKSPSKILSNHSPILGIDSKNLSFNPDTTNNSTDASSFSPANFHDSPMKTKVDPVKEGFVVSEIDLDLNEEISVNDCNVTLSEVVTSVESSLNCSNSMKTSTTLESESVSLTDIPVLEMEKDSLHYSSHSVTPQKSPRTSSISTKSQDFTPVKSQDSLTCDDVNDQEKVSINTSEINVENLHNPSANLESKNFEEANSSYNIINSEIMSSKEEALDLETVIQVTEGSSDDSLVEQTSLEPNDAVIPIDVISESGLVEQENLNSSCRFSNISTEEILLVSDSASKDLSLSSSEKVNMSTDIELGNKHLNESQNTSIPSEEIINTCRDNSDTCLQKEVLLDTFNVNEIHKDSSFISSQVDTVVDVNKSNSSSDAQPEKRENLNSSASNTISAIISNESFQSLPETHSLLNQSANDSALKDNAHSSLTSPKQIALNISQDSLNVENAFEKVMVAEVETELSDELTVNSDEGFSEKILTSSPDGNSHSVAMKNSPNVSPITSTKEFVSNVINAPDTFSPERDLQNLPSCNTKTPDEQLLQVSSNVIAKDDSFFASNPLVCPVMCEGKSLLNFSFSDDAMNGDANKSGIFSPDNTNLPLPEASMRLMSFTPSGAVRQNSFNLNKEEAPISEDFMYCNETAFLAFQQEYGLDDSIEDDLNRLSISPVAFDCDESELINIEQGNTHIFNRQEESSDFVIRPSLVGLSLDLPVRSNLLEVNSNRLEPLMECDISPTINECENSVVFNNSVSQFISNMSDAERRLETESLLKNNDTNHDEQFRPVEDPTNFNNKLKCSDFVMRPSLVGLTLDVPFGSNFMAANSTKLEPLMECNISPTIQVCESPIPPTKDSTIQSISNESNKESTIGIHFLEECEDTKEGELNSNSKDFVSENFVHESESSKSISDVNLINISCDNVFLLNVSSTDTFSKTQSTSSPISLLDSSTIVYEDQTVTSLDVCDNNSEVLPIETNSNLEKDVISSYKSTLELSSSEAKSDCSNIESTSLSISTMTDKNRTLSSELGIIDISLEATPIESLSQEIANVPPCKSTEVTDSFNASKPELVSPKTSQDSIAVNDKEQTAHSSFDGDSLGATPVKIQSCPENVKSSQLYEPTGVAAVLSEDKSDIIPVEASDRFESVSPDSSLLNQVEIVTSVLHIKNNSLEVTPIKLPSNKIDHASPPCEMAQEIILNSADTSIVESIPLNNLVDSTMSTEEEQRAVLDVSKTFLEDSPSKLQLNLENDITSPLCKLTEKIAIDASDSPSATNLISPKSLLDSSISVKQEVTTVFTFEADHKFLESPPVDIQSNLLNDKISQCEPPDKLVPQTGDDTKDFTVEVSDRLPVQVTSPSTLLDNSTLVNQVESATSALDAKDNSLEAISINDKSNTIDKIESTLNRSTEKIINSNIMLLDSSTLVNQEMAADLSLDANGNSNTSPFKIQSNSENCVISSLCKSADDIAMGPNEDKTDLGFTNEKVLKQDEVPSEVNHSVELQAPGKPEIDSIVEKPKNQFESSVSTPHVNNSNGFFADSNISFAASEAFYSVYEGFQTAIADNEDSFATCISETIQNFDVDSNNLNESEISNMFGNSTIVSDLHSLSNLHITTPDDVDTIENNSFKMLLDQNETLYCQPPSDETESLIFKASAEETVINLDTDPISDPQDSSVRLDNIDSLQAVSPFEEVNSNENAKLENSVDNIIYNIINDNNDNQDLCLENNNSTDINQRIPMIAIKDEKTAFLVEADVDQVMLNIEEKILDETNANLPLDTENSSQQPQPVVLEEDEVETLQAEIEHLKKTKDTLSAVNNDVLTLISNQLNNFHGTKKQMTNNISEAMLCQKDIRKERDQAWEDIRNVEKAFSELMSRYEKTKSVLEQMKENEVLIKKQNAVLEDEISDQEKKFNLLQNQAEERLELSNDELVKTQKEKESEKAALSVMLRRAEIKIRSLTNTLGQKVEENAELSRMCDEFARP